MIHEFASFRIDVQRQELWRGKEELSVEPQVFQLLVYLIENCDRVVSKDDLIEHVWNGRIVSDATLSTRINGVRKILGDDGKRQDIIRTVPRRGFRFIAELKGKTGAAPLADAADASDRPGRQTIRFCTAHDGLRIAYAISGQGPPLLKAPNWLHHLEYDWESPVWGHMLHALSEKRTLIRFDQRGNGLSDRHVPEYRFDDMVDDLHTVAEAAGLDRFPLFGVSQGCAYSVAYAHRHPEKVSHLILYGGFLRGLRLRVEDDGALDAELRLRMIREGWGRNNPAFRQFFTSLFIPGADKEQMDWFNELQKKTIDGESAARTQDMVFSIDIKDIAAELDVPTLVLHCRGDAVSPLEGGRGLAAQIPNAKFVALEGNNHLFLEHEPARQRFIEEVDAFLADA